MLLGSPSHVERLHRLGDAQPGSVYVYQEVFRQFQIQPPSDSNLLENPVESSQPIRDSNKLLNRKR